MRYQSVLNSAKAEYNRGSYHVAGIKYLEAIKILPHYYPDLSANYLKAAKCFAHCRAKARSYKYLRVEYHVSV